MFEKIEVNNSKVSKAESTDRVPTEEERQAIINDVDNKLYARKQYETSRDKDKGQAIKNVTELIERKRRESKGAFPDSDSKDKSSSAIEKKDSLENAVAKKSDQKVEQSDKLQSLNFEEQKVAAKEIRDRFFREREKKYEANPELKMKALDVKEFDDYCQQIWSKYEELLLKKNPKASAEALQKIKAIFEAENSYRKIFDPRKKGWEEKLNRPKVKIKIGPDNPKFWEAKIARMTMEESKKTEPWSQEDIRKFVEELKKGYERTGELPEVGPDSPYYWKKVTEDKIKELKEKEPTWSEEDIRSYMKQLQADYERTRDLSKIRYDTPKNFKFREKLRKEQTFGRTMKSLFRFK